MRRIRLIHWNSEEARERADRIDHRRCRVDWGVPHGPDFFRELNADPPDVVVIDLSRLPSQGRDAALAVRQYKAMRAMPVVFAGGDPEKAARIRSLIPDAEYCGWECINAAIDRAFKAKPRVTTVPKSRFAAYAGAPLAKKLGIRGGSTVALIGAPDGFESILRTGQYGMPDGAAVRIGREAEADLVLWFIRSRRIMERRLPELSRRIDRNRLWIIWPKKASGIVSDLTQAVVRRAGLDAGLVDYKICSVDETWSGLLFTRRPFHRSSIKKRESHVS
jgi:hypothetical protein